MVTDKVFIWKPPSEFVRLSFYHFHEHTEKFKFYKEKRVEIFGRFLKMIDDLQTPEHKTNHKYRRLSTLFVHNI